MLILYYVSTQKTLEIPEFVVVSSRYGICQDCKKYASYLNLPTVICDKVRKDHSEKAEIIEMFGEIRDKKRSDS